MLAWCRKTEKGASRNNGELTGARLPEIDDELSHLPELMEDIGWIRSTGMGAVAVEYRELQAWAELTGFDLRPDEAHAMHQMSSAYAGQVNSTSNECPVKDEATTEAIEMAKARAMIASALHG